MNTDILSKILTREQYERKRTPLELEKWVEEVNSILSDTDKTRRYRILEKGIGKNFISEILPLNIFAQHYYKECSDILLKPKFGDQSFDAQIFQREEDLYNVEVTEAINGKRWALQKELLLKKGWAPGTGQIECKSRKHNRKNGDIKAISEGRYSHEIFKETLQHIGEALQRKSRKQSKYGNKTLLLLVFDDYTGFNPDKNEKELQNFVSEKIRSLNLNSHKIFLIGWSRKAFYEFPIQDD